MLTLKLKADAEDDLRKCEDTHVQMLVNQNSAHEVIFKKYRDEMNIEMKDRVERVRGLQAGEMEEQSLKIRNEHMSAIERYRDEIMRHKVMVDAEKESNARMEDAWSRQHKLITQGHKQTLAQYEAKESRAMLSWRREHENASEAEVISHQQKLLQKEDEWKVLARAHEDTLAQYEAKESRAMLLWRKEHEDASAAEVTFHQRELLEHEDAWSRQHRLLRRGHEDTLTHYEANESRAMLLWRKKHEDASAAEVDSHRRELHKEKEAWSRQHRLLRRGHEDTLTQYEAKESRAMLMWREKHEDASTAEVDSHRRELHEEKEAWSRQHKLLTQGHEDTLAQYEAKESRAMLKWRREHADVSAAEVDSHRQEIHEREQEWMVRHKNKHSNSIKTIESAMRKIVKAAKKQHSDLKSQSDRSTLQDLQLLRDEHSERLQSLRAQHQDALQNQRQELNRIRNQSSDSSTILRKHRDKIEEQRDEMRLLEEHRDRHETIAISTKREAEKLKQELHAERRNSSSAMEELQRLHENEKLKLAAERDTLVRQHRDSLSSVKDSHENMLKRHRSDSSNVLEKNRGEMKQLQDKLRIYEQKVFQSRSTYQQQYGELMGNHEDSLNTLRDEHKRSLKKLQKEHQEKAKLLEQHTEKLKSHFENRMVSQAKDFNRRSILQRDRMSRSYSKIREKLHSSHKKEIQIALSRQREELLNKTSSSTRSPKLKISDNGQLRVSSAKISDEDYMDENRHPAEIDLKKTLASLGFE